MTNEELHEKVIETHTAVTRVEGAITNLTSVLEAHFQADEKAQESLQKQIDTVTGALEKRVDAVEKTQSKAIWLALGAIVEGAVIFFTGSNKH